MVKLPIFSVLLACNSGVLRAVRGTSNFWGCAGKITPNQRILNWIWSLQIATEQPPTRFWSLQIQSGAATEHPLNQANLTALIKRPIWRLNLNDPDVGQLTTLARPEDSRFNTAPRLPRIKCIFVRYRKRYMIRISASESQYKYKNQNRSLFVTWLFSLLVKFWPQH